jgi:outer membrane protein TolC
MTSRSTPNRCQSGLTAWLCLLAALACSQAVARDEAPAQHMTLPQLLQQVLDYYPSLQSAALQVRQARQNATVIESRLGWQLGAQAGASKDLSLFGSPVTSLTAAGQLQRQLADGDSMSLNASLSRDDADTTLPTLPNPSLSSNLEFQYRKPLRQGKENTGYHSDLQQAEATVTRLQAVQQQGYDQIAAQLIDLYASMLATQKRIDTTGQTLRRSRRLHQFILDRVDFGIAEDKDRLQTEAQLSALQAQLRALELVRTRQLINLNRLLGRPWTASVELVARADDSVDTDLDTLITETRDHSPALQINVAELKLADAAIARQTDNSRDKLDLVFSVGQRGLNGDSAAGSVNNNELVGGVQVEFGRTMDRRGDDAALYQARLQRDSVLQDRKQILSDLRYNVATRVAELKGIRAAIAAYRRNVGDEQAKLAEAEKRYRNGRITIDRVIQFENETGASELELALQQIEYQRSYNHLRLMRGTLWDDVRLPRYFDNNGQRR